MIKNIISSYKHIPYTICHYFYFMKIQKKLLGRYKYLFHDLDKILMYIFIPWLGTKKIKKIHQSINKHYIKIHKFSYECNYEEAIIDWECFRFSKKEKQMTAREYLEYKKPILLGSHYDNLNKVLIKLNL